MAFKDKQNPITVENLIYNILCSTGDIGRAPKVMFVEGEVVGVPFAPKEMRGFRNILHKAITLGENDETVVRVYANQGVTTSAFKGHSHDGWWKIINSLFVKVKPDPLEDKTVVCLNLVVSGTLPATTPTPTL